MADPILRVRGEDGKITEIYSYKGDQGKDGVSITNAYINDSNELILELSEGQPINLGVVVGADGYTPVKGTDYTDGADGVGITKIEQTTTSDADGGENIITVTLDNGNSVPFSVKNGSKGSDGNPGTHCTHSWNGTTLTVTSASGSSSADLKGMDGTSFDSLWYDSSTNKWVYTTNSNGAIFENSFDGPVVPTKVTDLSDSDNYYTSEEIDAMFGSYVDEVAAIIGGDA